jgi:hypothetical protein
VWWGVERERKRERVREDRRGGDGEGHGEITNSSNCHILSHCVMALSKSTNSLIPLS